LNDLSILKDIVVSDVADDPKGLQAAKEGSHFVESFHCVWIDCRGGGSVGLMCAFCKNRRCDGTAENKSDYD
jgi:hypothetical protein